MDGNYREYVAHQWKKYFKDAELPLAYFYSDEALPEDAKNSRETDRCLICNLNRVREGHPFVFSEKSSGCEGGKRYSGFSAALRPDFEYFLSCGIPGKVEGERYKKSPELAKKLMANNLPFEAPRKFLVFKRWDKLKEHDTPLALIFFATADVLSGLFTLANFDIDHYHGVVAPMGSGCSSIISYPLKEAESENPACVLGMFDVSARPCVPKHTLTFTVPFARFEQMVANMDESFLITDSWKQVKRRIK